METFFGIDFSTRTWIGRATLFISISIGAFILLTLFSWIVPSEPKEIVAPEFIKETESISFEIMDTDEERAQGLSGRTHIPEDYGMLFVFDRDGQYGFWMKDMKESIDILWLTHEGEVVEINAEVSPDTYPTSFYPPHAIRYVLEMKAGEAHRQGFEVGSVLDLPL